MIPTPPPNIALDIGDQFVIATPRSYVIVNIDGDGVPCAYTVPYAHDPISPTSLARRPAPVPLERGG